MTIFDLAQTQPVLTAGLIVLASSLGFFFTKLYQARMLIIDRQKKGLVGETGPSVSL